MNTHIHYVLYVDILKHADVLQENLFSYNVRALFMVANPNPYSVPSDIVLTNLSLIVSLQFLQFY
jgi:hypothetical protein